MTKMINIIIVTCEFCDLGSDLLSKPNVRIDTSTNGRTTYRTAELVQGDAETATSSTVSACR